MKIVGLTGGIAMGKSTCSRIFREHRIPIFDADAAIHDILATDPRAAFDLVWLYGERVVKQQGGIDRLVLREIVHADPTQLLVLGDLMEPYVTEALRGFLRRRRRSPVVILDVPLLFERGWDKIADTVVTISVRPSLQRERAIRRGTQAHMFDAFSRFQLSDAERCRRANYVIRNGLNIRHTRMQIKKFLKSL